MYILISIKVEKIEIGPFRPKIHNFVFFFSVEKVKNFYLAKNGTCMASRYSSVAIFDASATFRQSMSQNRADTVVVNETQSLMNVSGVEPVTSSHCALDVPPINTETGVPLATPDTRRKGRLRVVRDVR